MDGLEAKVCGYVCATAICVAALLVDGATAQTMAIATAAGIAGLTGYDLGKTKAAKH